MYDLQLQSIHFDVHPNYWCEDVCITCNISQLSLENYVYIT